MNSQAMTDAPRLTDEEAAPCPFCERGMLKISGMGLYWRHPNPSDCILSGITITTKWLPQWNRRAQQSEGAQAKAVIQREVIHYRDLIEKGKGTHGQPGYVRDDTWNYWQGRLSMAEELLRALAPPHGQTEEKR